MSKENSGYIDHLCIKRDLLKMAINAIKKIKTLNPNGLIATHKIANNGSNKYSA